MILEPLNKMIRSTNLPGLGTLLAAAAISLGSMIGTGLWTDAVLHQQGRLLQEEGAQDDMSRRLTYLNREIARAARDFVETGSASAYAEYGLMTRELDDWLAILKAGPTSNVAVADEVGALNDRLIFIERTAMATALAGNRSAAERLLGSKDYLRTFFAFDEAVHDWAEQNEAAIQDKALIAGRNLNRLNEMRSFLLTLIVGCWVAALFFYLQQQEKLRAAKSALENHQLHLEDIVKLRTAELNAARVAAESASNAKSIFLAYMSHEIRTPMNGVLGLIEALRQTELDEKQRKILRVIADAGSDLQTILNDVLDFSKIEAGKIDLKPVPFAVNDIAEDVLGLFQGKAAQKQLTLSVAIAPEIDSRYCGDVIRIRQILFNLVSNALKFTDKGGASIDFAKAPGDTGLEITVKDTGPGLSQEQLPRMFRPFEQFDNKVTKENGGTGLGLMISRRLAHLMDGSISVESELGKGTMFTLTLPLERVPEEQETVSSLARTEPVPTAARAGLRLLIADDNERNRFVMETILAPTGATIVQAADGFECLERFVAENFDAILLDIQMPGLSGVDVARQIRSYEGELGKPRTPIIAVSANDFGEQIAEYLAAGMDSHVSKPISPTLLIRTIAMATGPQKSAA